MQTNQPRACVSKHLLLVAFRLQEAMFLCPNHPRASSQRNSPYVTEPMGLFRPARPKAPCPAHPRASRWLSDKEKTCQCRRCGFYLWVWKIPWKRRWQRTAVFLPGKSHGWRSLAGYSPWDLRELDMMERLSGPNLPLHPPCLPGTTMTKSLLHAPTSPFCLLTSPPASPCGPEWSPVSVLRAFE